MTHLRRGVWLAALMAGGVMAGLFSPELAAATLPPVKPVMPCTDLKSLDFARIGSVTMRIDSAEETTGGARQVCAVKGYLAPQVNFEVLACPPMLVAWWCGPQLVGA